MITSSKNSKLQKVRALLEHHKRGEPFVAEGVRLVEEGLSAGWQPELMLYSAQISERGRTLIQNVVQTGTSVEEVDERVFRSLTATENPQGLLAVFPPLSKPLPENWSLLLIIDQLRDPGNLGTILRTAHAVGVDGIFLTSGSVDPFSSKVIRAGMGAHFHLSLFTENWDLIVSTCQQKHARVLLAETNCGDDLWSTNLRGPIALVIGGEAEGASETAHKLADACIHIPMPGQSESLNAAVAAAILLFEVVRQRTE